MTTYQSGMAVGAIIGSLGGFLAAYWLILGYIHGWWGDRP